MTTLVTAALMVATLQSLALVPKTLTVNEGATAGFVAVGTYPNGVRRTLPGKVTWSSSDDKVAVITGDGMFRAIGPGKVAIKAVTGNLTASGSLVVRPRLVGLSLTPRSLTLRPGATDSFAVRGRYSDGTVRLLAGQAIWSISGNAAVIDPRGLLTAIRGGTATVVAEVQGIRAAAQLIVPETAAPPPPAIAPAPSAAPAVAGRPAVLLSVSVEPERDTFPTRETLRLSAFGRYSDGTVRDITRDAVWSSADVRVARVDSEGVVYGERFGTATIAATLESYSGVAALTVTPIIARIDIAPSPLSLKHHAMERLSAIATLTDDSTRDVTSEVTWTSSDAASVRVDGGAVEGLAPGSATVTVSLGDFGASCAVAVEPVVQSIDVQPSSADLLIGQTRQLSASAWLSDGSTKDVTGSVVWSADYGAVQVSAGYVTAIAEGTVRVHARLDSVEGAATVNVTKPVVRSLSISPSGVSLQIGQSVAFSAFAFYSDGTTVDVTGRASWESTNGAVVSVSGSGAIAVGAGSAVVRATIDSVSATAGVSVSAPPAPP